MDNLLNLAGTALGLLGIVICAITVVTRLAGSYYLGGFELLPLLTGGSALLLMAVLAKLQVLILRSR